MPDPIGGVNSTAPLTPATSTGNTAGPASAEETAIAAAGSAAASDLADVSQTEALLQSIVDAANQSPGVDQGKVAELQKAISSGAYQVNPQSIAQKLVELESQLGTAGQLQ